MEEKCHHHASNQIKGDGVNYLCILMHQRIRANVWSNLVVRNLYMIETVSKHQGSLLKLRLCS